ncbi:nitrous oxide reductase accessory protein NosL [Pseudomonas sp. B21-040]|jgi:copper chaperone NosL|uniref:nitrous oxide reductase accessory protein NosL n=1 Tax=Pseudomonas TaxID=286 RepID=UPI0005FBA36F|nr:MULTISPECIES: nitrous oxide reductase accessory protein NosL [Pseudomonas]KJZ39569.1 NosL protein [Pseudomonas fluorescens]OOG11210.1 NosL protein [Pseudomonas sp. C9]PWK35720.1 copper chaperone NosL [Pseudomonas sp. OV226]UVL42631.1 nitrous oxide reductase accessory protein NosL [Pseudomonas sp. B21-040]
MKNRYYTTLRAMAGLMVCLLLTACDKPAQAAYSDLPSAFHPSDECHVCGMIINGFPGPKGEVVEPGGIKKFCSTAEMIGWWLQPENHHGDARLYVHDMGRSPWNAPDDSQLIDAKDAFYVVGTGLKGAMGIVLASFSSEQAAQKLATEQGGRVLRFGDIDQSVLQQPAMSHATH